ncbi:MAG: hypothetical protein CMD40_00245 [Gammaproteobacteria bacterium]|nr:hypothetical protein [Gammaproteobacteria bacterium]
MEFKDLKWLNDIYTNINFDNIPHGIIISGPEGLGKKLLAKEICSKLLVNKNSNLVNMELILANNHPDYFYLNKDKILLHHITYRKNKWDEEIGHRNVNDFLNMTPSLAKNKVAVITNGHTMNDESQNALLKSLEEPSPNTFIIILTNRHKSLLNTIYSRCQVINVNPLKKADLNEWLISKGISDVNATDFPSFMSPLRILDDLEKNEHLNFKEFINILIDFLSSKSDIHLTIKSITALDINLIMKINYLIEFLKIILKSKLLSENLSGIYNRFNNSTFSNLKISNLINDLNDLRFDYFKVPQINETHVLNYFLSEVKNSIKI